jgi:hypothetical protein
VERNRTKACKGHILGLLVDRQWKG